MTNINCSDNCVYQHDGKCYFEHITQKIVTPSFNCAYFLYNNTVAK